MSRVSWLEDEYWADEIASLYFLDELAANFIRVHTKRFELLLDSVRDSVCLLCRSSLASSSASSTSIVDLFNDITVSLDELVRDVDFLTHLLNRFILSIQVTEEISS